MSEGKKDQAQVVRMVRWNWTEQYAEWAADFQSFPVERLLPLLTNFGNRVAAERAADLLLLEQFQRLPREPDRDLMAQLLKFDQLNVALAGVERVGETELGLYSASVAPNYGRKEWDYSEWVQKGLRSILRGDGRRISVAANTGAGKTHVLVKWMEWALLEGWTVLANFTPLKDTTTKHSDRIHYVRRLSDVLRTIATSPRGTKFLLGLDEPEAALRGSNSLAVQNWSTFLNFIRKLSLDVFEIWHDLDEQYKAGRQGTGPKFYRIEKPAKDRMTIHSDSSTVHVRSIGGLDFLEYDHEAQGTFTVDVNMAVIQDALGPMETDADRKQRLLELLDEPGTYLPGYGPVLDASASTGPDLEGIAVEIVADPVDVLNTKGNVDKGLVKLRFPGLTHRDAETVAKLANVRRAQDADPGD